MLRKINTIYRITDWLHYLGFALMGFVLKVSFVDVTNFEELFLVLILSSSLMSYAYSLNDYFDKGKKKEHFLLPLVLLIALSPLFNFSQVLLGTVFLVLVTLYSFPGISLMKLPIASTLSNSLGFMIIFAMGYMTEEGITVLGIVFFLLLAIYQTVSQLIHERVHLGEDIESGRKTSVFYLKEKTTLFIRGMLILTFPLFLFLLLRTDFIFFAIACVLFSLIFLIKAGQIDKQLRKRYKLAGIIVGLLFLLDYFLILINNYN